MTFGKNFSTTWIQSYSSIWSCFCHAFQAAARYVSHGSIRLLHKKCNLIPIQTSLKTNWSRPHKTLLLETWNTWDSWLLDWSRKKSIFQSFNILESFNSKKSKDVLFEIPLSKAFQYWMCAFTYLTNVKRASPLPKSLLHKDHKVNGSLFCTGRI